MKDPKIPSHLSHNSSDLQNTSPDLQVQGEAHPLQIILQPTNSQTAEFPLSTYDLRLTTPPTSPTSPLKQFTPARIALGKTGNTISIEVLLELKVAHAAARDAVYDVLNESILKEQLQAFQLPLLNVQTAATNRSIYLKRPDLGRQLNDQSKLLLKNLPQHKPYDIAISIADGLSATAINLHAIPFLQHFIPLLKQSNYSIAPICTITQGRVAVSDEIGSLLNATISIILIGERPGMSSCDSLGIYLTYHPTIGKTDETRNCISNVRPQGLHCEDAANMLHRMVQKAFALQLSGVDLKDNDEIRLVPNKPDTL